LFKATPFNNKQDKKQQHQKIQKQQTKRRKKPLTCKVCKKEAKENGFCAQHQRAYDNLMESYSFWRKALKISWQEYLSQVAKNSLTGDWVKEVAKYLIENEETKNVKQS
jgi:hypothetical protein